MWKLKAIHMKQRAETQKTCDSPHSQRFGRTLEDVCSIFNRDYFQRRVRKRFCYRPRYIPCLSLRLARLASPPHSALEMFLESGPIWISVFAQHSRVIRPSSSMVHLEHVCLCMAENVRSSWLRKVLMGGMCRQSTPGDNVSYSGSNRSIDILDTKL